MGGGVELHCVYVCDPYLISSPWGSGLFNEI